MSAAGGRPSSLGLIARLRRRWRERDCVTVCLPAYNAAGFITDTLQSIAAQSYRNIRVLISLDLSDDGTDEVCRPFLADPRFTLIRQPARLGWPGNVNFLLDQVRSKYYFIIFHDDRIKPDYVARLIRRLRKSPATMCAYPLQKQFGGGREGEVSIESVAGDRFERALGFLKRPFNSAALRGLTRSEALRQGLRLRDLGTAGFLAELLYVFELALIGECARVGRTIYYTRYRPDSVSKGWLQWSIERKRTGWRHLLRQLNAIVARQGFTEQQQGALLEAALPWAYQHYNWLPADASEQAAIADPARRAALARAWANDPEGNPPFL